MKSRLGNGSKLPATWNNKKRPKKNFAFGDRREGWCRFHHTYSNIQILWNLSKNRVTPLSTFNVAVIVDCRIPKICSWRRLSCLRKFPEQEKISEYFGIIFKIKNSRRENTAKVKSHRIYFTIFLDFDGRPSADIKLSISNWKVTGSHPNCRLRSAPCFWPPCHI